eukprot:12650555-Alexandrium_andersonii.AAC.1
MIARQALCVQHPHGPGRAGMDAAVAEADLRSGARSLNCADPGTALLRALNPMVTTRQASWSAAASSRGGTLLKSASGALRRRRFAG